MSRTPALRACLVSCLVFSLFGILWEAGAAEYYVATNGNDSNPGAIDQPWRTINHAADVMVAGDTVLVRGGTYNLGPKPFWNTPSANPKNSGTADAPITFKAYPGETVVVEGTIGSHERDYITWDGFVVFRSALLFGSNTSPRMKGCVIRNCVIEGAYVPTTDNHDGIRIENASGTIIRDNIIRNVAGDSLNSSGIKLYNTDNTIVEHNDIYGNTSGIFDKEEGTDNVYRRNLIHDNDGLNFKFATQGGNNSRGMEFYENILYNGSGVYFSTDPTMDFADTEIYSNVLPYIHTIYAPNLQIWDNIISNGYRCREGGTPTYADHNDFWVGEEFETGVYTDNHVVYNTLNEWQAGIGMDLNSLHQDPLYVDSANYDFHLQAGSPCIGTGKDGLDMGAYPRNDGTIIGPRMEDTSPPYTSGHNPAKGATQVSRYTDVVVHVRDGWGAVDVDSIVMTVEGLTVVPTITGSAWDYTLTYDPPSGFNRGQVVNVTIDAQDMHSPPNVMTQDAYSFTIEPLDHPRLLVRPEDIPVLRAKCGISGYEDIPEVQSGEVTFGEFADDYAAVKQKADSVAGTGDNSNEALTLLGFAHIIENYPGISDAYSNHVKNALLSELHMNSAAEPVVAFGWIYDTLTTGEATTVANTFISSYFYVISPNTIPWEAGTLGSVIAPSVAKSIALNGEFPPGSAEDSLVESVLYSLIAYMPGNFTIGLNQAGALTQESPHYAMDCEYHIPMILEMWQTGLGNDVWSGVSQSVARYGDYYMWYRNPYLGGDTGIPTRDDCMSNSISPPVETIALIANRGGSPVAQWYANRAQYADSDLPNGWRNWRKILWHDSSLAEANMFVLPTSKGLGGGYIVMRSGWEDGATVAMFQVGDYFSGHQHADSGSFQVYRKGRLAIDSGAYIEYQAVPANGGGGGYEHAGDYYQRSISHNIVTIYDPNETFLRFGESWKNDGGQRYLESPDSAPIVEGSEYDTGDIERSPELTDNYDYVFGNITEAYSGKVTNATRQFVFLRPDYFVVFDRVSSIDPSFTRDWLLHFENRPQVNGGDLDPAKLVRGTNAGGMWEYNDADLVTVTDGDGKLFVKSLLPANKILRIVGGPKNPMTIPSGPYAGTTYYGGTSGSFEYWDKPGNKPGGQNRWFYLGNPTELGNDSFVANGWGRMEVEPTVPALNDVFLHVLYPCDIAVPSMPTTSLVDAGEMCGTYVIDSPCDNWVVLFSKIEADAKRADYSVPTQGPVKHLLCDLELGIYTIDHDSVTIATKAASIEGTLYFDSTSGGSFSIYQSGTGDTSPPYTSGHNPTDNATAVPRDANVVIYVQDGGDLDPIVMTVGESTVAPTITGSETEY